MASYTFSLPSSVASAAGSTANTINQNLYSRTADEDLTYSGSDDIVWDRVNAERLRRGLPSLTEIGIPRPPPTEEPTTETPSNGPRTFTIKGPAGMTEAQARAIFDEQVRAGSFVGFKPGDVLNSAKQAAAGLPGAASQLTQSLTGSASILNGAVLSNPVGQISGQISRALNQTVSVAKQAINNVTDIISKVPVTNPINTADFAKQLPALTSIGNLNPVDVRSGIAQASKLVGQAADTITNTGGVGKFGFDAPQLEAAGILKPGIAAKYLQSGANSLTSVLKSPTVFTGKDGIKSLTDLLSSDLKQDGIQQNLMAQGFNGLKQVGIPVNNLNPSALSGTVLNAAKNLPAAADWAKGLPIPGDLKSTFDTVAKDASFAVNFANQKVNNALKQEIIPEPASNTVNRETVNAAASRVVGNAKVPAVSYNSEPAQRTDRELDAAMTEINISVNALIDDSIRILSKTDRIRDETNSYSRDIREFELIVAGLNQASGQFLTILREAKALTPVNGAIVARAEALIEKVKKAIANIQSAIDQLRRTIENKTV